MCDLRTALLWAKVPYSYCFHPAALVWLRIALWGATNIQYSPSPLYSGSLKMSVYWRKSKASPVSIQWIFIFLSGWVGHLLKINWWRSKQIKNDFWIPFLSFVTRMIAPCFMTLKNNTSFICRQPCRPSGGNISQALTFSQIAVDFPACTTGICNVWLTP